MKYRVIGFAIICTFLTMSLAHAQVPRLINYQGQLKQNNLPVSETFQMKFSIYNVAEGGTVLWDEDQTVSVSEGVFNVLLGSSTPFPDTLFTGSGKRYLGVAVGSDSEMRPRFKFASVAFALNAAAVETNSISTQMLENDAVTSDKIAPNIVSSIDGVSNDGGNIDLEAGTNVTITPDDANNRITISASGGNGGDNLGNHTAIQNLILDNHWISNDGQNEGITVDDVGNVGVGTASPTQKLTVAGTVESTSGGFKFPDGTIQTTADTGGSVDGDDLGDHRARQNLRLDGHWLSGDGGNEGLQVNSVGNIGIGTTTPSFPLSFSNTLGDKISLWRGQTGAHYGLGVQSTLLQIYTDIQDGDIAFGYGSSASFTETMRVKGNGNVGIGTTTPSQKLTVAGIIESTSGGFTFPDGTTQSTAVSGGSGLTLPYNNDSYSGNDDAFRIEHNGTGNILDLRQNNTGNGHDALNIDNNGDGSAARFFNTNPNSVSPVLYVQSNSPSDEVAFFNLNNVNGGSAVRINSNGTGGAALSVEMTGNREAARIEVNNTSSNYYALKVTTNASSNKAGRFEGNIYVTGDIQYEGTLTDFSDKRLKENIRSIKAPLEKLSYINGVYFNMIGSKQKELGVIAQDVQRSIPEAVNIIDAKNGYFGVNYSGLIAVLIEGMKEQQSIIESQNTAILETERRLKKIEVITKATSDALKIYKGQAQLESGEITIQLPKTFDALNHPKGREINLTCVNGWSPLYLDGEIKNNQFVVKTTEDGNPEQEFSWIVYAVRNDENARENPIVVEEEKGVNNDFKKGELLYSSAANNR